MDAISTGAPGGRAKKLVPPCACENRDNQGEGAYPTPSKKQEHIYIKKSTGIMTSSIHNKQIHNI